ncbi:50S ribosomal protein L5 [Candidatus Woesearchaeota archaeon CG_4_10_14_0_8_um_filter_47_5]|nr:MAG: 50S ribosomal protein L5 [Candidatus Woesearchaeota archaeon CG_4_10_14_0_8_um_filter_47_5]
MDTNPMRQIHVEKVTLNIGVGKNPKELEKATKLLKRLSDAEPIRTFTNKRIQAWGLRPGLPLGCKVTLRKEEAVKKLRIFLAAKEKTLKKRQFDDEGNVSFGIHEYLDIPDARYDPEIGMLGMNVCITLERKGYRIKRRKIKSRKIPKKSRIAQQESIEFMKQEFGVIIEE